MQEPGPSEYRAMTVYCQFYSEPQYKLKISKGVYFPQPKVDGALVEFTLKPEEERGILNDDAAFITMVRLRPLSDCRACYFATNTSHELVPALTCIECIYAVPVLNNFTQEPSFQFLNL